MKINLYKIFVLFLLSTIWILPSLEESFSIHRIIFVVGYFFTLMCFIIIKDVFVGYLFILIVILLSFTFEQSYLKLMVSPLFITCGYIHFIKEDISKDIGNTIDIGVIISILGSIIFAIYSFFMAENNVITINVYDASHSVVLGCLLFFLITAISQCFLKKTVKKNKKKKREKKRNNKNFNIYVANLICFSFTIILYYFTNTFEDYQNIRIVFFPWFLYCCLIMLYDEMFSKELFNTTFKLKSE